MSNERKSGESREEALERILAETAGGKYRRTAPQRQRDVRERVSQPEEKPSETMTEAEKAAAAKARAAEKIAEIKRRKQLEEQQNAAVYRKKYAETAEADAGQPSPEKEAKPAVRKTETEKGEVHPQEKPAVQDAEDRSEAEINENNSAEPGKKHGKLYDVLDIAECVIAAAFVVFLVFTFLIHIASVQGTSMVPTLEEGDRILVSAFGYTPENGDVIVIDNETAGLLSEDGRITEKDGLGKSIIKRVIAKGGQTVNINFETGEVFVDGKEIDEPYIREVTHRDAYAFDYPLEIPEGYLFVMGDNRNVSKDSRHPDVGLIPEDEVIGKALARVYPFGSFGGIS
ncbi:MAG: signal peptidase I [Porcipelethomonas sp.]